MKHYRHTYFLIFLSVFTYGNIIYSNPFPVGGPGFNPFPIFNKNKNISLDFERIIINDSSTAKIESMLVGKPDYDTPSIEYDCTYLLKNYSNLSIDLDICLPSIIIDSVGSLSEIKILNNNKPIEYSTITLAIKTDRSEISVINGPAYSYHYNVIVFNIIKLKFKPNESKNLQFLYKSIKPIEPPRTYGTYILKTGNLWKIDVVKCEIIYNPKILTDNKIPINYETIKKYYSFNYTNFIIKNNKLYFQFDNFKPEMNFNFFCSFDPQYDENNFSENYKNIKRFLFSSEYDDLYFHFLDVINHK